MAYSEGRKMSSDISSYADCVQTPVGIQYLIANYARVKKKSSLDKCHKQKLSVKYREKLSHKGSFTANIQCSGTRQYGKRNH